MGLRARLAAAGAEPIAPQGPSEDRVFEVFTEARRLTDEHVQEAYLNEACRGDSRLREEVSSLLLAAEQESMLDEGLSGSVAVAPLPERIGEYRILGLLGEGGMGRVYLAEQERPKRQVALKVLRGRWGRTEADRARFEREANILARLDHPGIAKCLAARMTSREQEPYIALEYVDGIPLLEYAEAAQLPRGDRLRLVEALCEAVHYAHQRGVVHRDLKPANLLVDGSGRPRILDFGIARLLDDDDAELTRTGQVSGTLSSMSPEQFDGDPARLDIRVDVWALGVIAFELLTGRPPFELKQSSISAARRIVQTTRPPRAGSLDPGLRGDLELILDKALATLPEDRYGTAHELGADIRRHLERKPIEAHPPSLAYTLKKAASRHRVALASSFAIVLAIVASLVAWQLWLSLESTRIALDRAALDARSNREREARELTSRDERARLSLLLSEVESWTSSTPIERDEELWRRLGGAEIWHFIHSLFERYEEGEALLEEELRRVVGKPTEPDVRALLASSYFQRGDLESAIDVLSGDSASSMPLSRSILADLVRDPPEEALLRSEERWSASGRLAEALDHLVFNAVSWHHREQQLERAIDLLDVAWRHRADRVSATTRAWYHQRFGGTYWLSGDYDAASSHFQAGLSELAGEDPGPVEIEGELRNNLATALRDAGRWPEAEAAYLEVVAFAKEHGLRRQLAASEINLARLLQRQDRQEDSRQHYERAWRVVTELKDPRADTDLSETRASLVLGIEALVGLALLELTGRRFDDARHLLELAEELRRARFGTMPHMGQGEVVLLRALVDWKESPTEELRDQLRQQAQVFNESVEVEAPRREHIRAMLRLHGFE
ncbi:MAG: serine/threonine-protein kinase [Planctomycetota bacterium]